MLAPALGTMGGGAASPLRARLPQLPIDAAGSVESQLSTLRATLEAAGFPLSPQAATQVQTPLGSLRLHLVLRDLDGREHGVILSTGHYGEGDFEDLWRALVIYRSDDRFCRSQLLLYCPSPIPPLLAYYCSDIPAVLFEAALSPAVALSHPYEVAAEAAVTAIARAQGWQWTFRQGDLLQLDDLVLGARMGNQPHLLATSLYALGSYVGELCGRTLGGSWERDATAPLRGRVVFAGGKVALHPFALVRDLLGGGRGQSVYLQVGKLVAELGLFKGTLVQPRFAPLGGGPPSHLPPLGQQPQAPPRDPEGA